MRIGVLLQRQYSKARANTKRHDANPAEDETRGAPARTGALDAIPTPRSCLVFQYGTHAAFALLLLHHDAGSPRELSACTCGDHVLARIHWRGDIPLVSLEALAIAFDEELAHCRDLGRDCH